MRAVPDQIAPWVPGDFASLGTDGFGLSDTRGALRRHFQVDAASIVVKVLGELARRGEVKPEATREAIDRYRAGRRHRRAHRRGRRRRRAARRHVQP